MSYPYAYNYSYGYGYHQGTVIIIALLVAVILAVVLNFTFLSKKNEGKYTGFFCKVYNFLCFNKFYAEEILKLVYIVIAAVITVMGFVAIFSTNFLGGLLIIVLGNVLVRVVYELIVMFIILCRKTVSIDKKLEKITKFYSDDFDEERPDITAEEACSREECGSCQGCAEESGEAGQSCQESSGEENEQESQESEETINTSDR